MDWSSDGIYIASGAVSWWHLIVSRRPWNWALWLKELLLSNFFYSGAFEQDPTVRIWDTSSGECRHVCKGAQRSAAVCSTPALDFFSIFFFCDNVAPRMTPVPSVSRQATRTASSACTFTPTAIAWPAARQTTPSACGAWTTASASAPSKSTRAPSMRCVPWWSHGD